MKPALTGMVMVFLFTTLSAQSSRTPLIPDNVMDQFILLYPDASDIQWTEQNDKYLAEFKNNKMETAALISADGRVLQTETEIRTIALPPDATAFLLEQIKVKKIEEATIIEETPGEITFTATADNAEYRFDHLGQPMGAQAVAVSHVSHAGGN